MGLLLDLGGSDLVVNSIATGSSAPASSGSKVISGNGKAVTSVTTTTSTYLAANILAGVIVNSAATAVTATLDTAANIVAAVKSAYGTANIGDLISFELVNGGSSSGAITLGAGSGGTFDANVAAANKVVAINLAKTIYIRLTAVVSGSEAYVVYM